MLWSDLENIADNLLFYNKRRDNHNNNNHHNNKQLSNVKASLPLSGLSGDLTQPCPGDQSDGCHTPPWLWPCR